MPDDIFDMVGECGISDSQLEELRELDREPHSHVNFWTFREYLAGRNPFANDVEI